MMKFLLAFFLALATPSAPSGLSTVDAALVQKLPRCALGNGYDANKDNLVDDQDGGGSCTGAADQFTTEAAGHYTIDVNDCDLAGTAVSNTDANANGGASVTIAPTAEGIFPHGQIRCLVTPAAGSYIVKIRVRAPNSNTKIWLSTSPMLLAPQPSNTLITDACTTANLCDAQNRILNFGWMRTGSNLSADGSQMALYFTWDRSMEIDCIDLNTANALPICPTGPVQQTPNFIALKSAGTPASCADLGAANVLDWTSGYNGGVTAPIVQLAWKAGSPATGYFCVTASDADIQAPTTADDDDAIFNDADDRFEVRLTPSNAATNEASMIMVVNPAATPAKWDAKVISGVETKANDFTMSCAKSGSWSVFCSFNFDFTIADNQLGLIQSLFGDKDAATAFVYRILGGTTPGGVNTPANYKVIQYSSTALQPPPPDKTPPTVGSLAFANIGSVSMQVSFTVADAESSCCSAFVSYGTSSQNNPDDYPFRQTCEVNGGIATCTLSGLTPSTSYFVRGTATNGVGLTTNTAEDNKATISSSVFYFNSSTGNDGRSCSQPTLPCRTLSRMLAVLTAGSTAVLQDGPWTTATGTGGNNVLQIDSSNGARSGTATNPITVTSANPRMALLSGNGLGATIRIDGVQYWVLDNLQVKNIDDASQVGQDNGQVIATGSTSSHITLQNNLLYHPNTYTGSGIILLQGTNQTVFKNELYQCHRNCIEAFGYSIATNHSYKIRQNYIGQMIASNCKNGPCGPNDLYVSYLSHDSIFESNIGEDSGNVCTGTCSLQDAMFYAKGYEGTAYNNSIYGNIAIGDGSHHTYLWGSWGTTNVIDNVSIAGGETAFSTSPSNYGNTTFNFTNNSIYSGPSPVNYIYEAQAGTFTGTYTNNMTIGTGGTQWSNNNTAQAAVARYNNVYGGTAAFGGNGSWTQSNNTTDAPTNLGQCVTHIPSNSNMFTGGLGGAQRGANTLYLYVDGVRTTTKLFDSSSGPKTANYGRWLGAGAVITGVNNAGAYADGKVASNVHNRLGFGASGTCTLPAGY